MKNFFLFLSVFFVCAGDLAAKVDSSRKIRSLNALKTQQEFKQLARIYYRGKFYALPHLMFAVDRTAKKVYFINSNLYAYHQDFLWTEYPVEKAQDFFRKHYANAHRRFVLGTLAFHQDLNKFSFELWEGDQIHAELLQDAYLLLKQSFFAPLYFKPNSLLHDRVLAEVNRVSSANPIPVLSEGELGSHRSYQPIQLGKGVGKLRIIAQWNPQILIQRDAIVIFREIPLQIPPVQGILTTAPASPLSHLSMLARGWKVPYAFIRNADERWKPLEGQYVRLEVNEHTYALKPATPAEIEDLKSQSRKSSREIAPRADLEFAQLTDLKDQGAHQANRFGAKSANLGELIRVHSPKFKVPQGFTIPFFFYKEFIDQNHLRNFILVTLKEERFAQDADYRRRRLSELRQKIESGIFSPQLEKMVLEKVRQEYANKSLFVRSSTNAEDLPHFSGAGLYTTVPNVRTEAQLIQAIKTVWASVWNFEAYEARDAFGMNHLAVYPAVLIQEGMKARSSGVAITVNLLDRSQKGDIHINAKQGLGMKVVEGKRLAEQLIYQSSSNSIKLLNRSQESSLLTLNEEGGVKEIPVASEERVLTEEQAWKLVRAAQEIQKIFNNQPQDIEWLFVGEELFIVQARPYLN